MRQINASTIKPIFLGFQGENDALCVRFDVSGWADTYGTGTFSLMNLRPTETVGYPCTVTVDGNIATWVVQTADVALEGYGRCQLSYTVDDVIAKSVQFITYVNSSIGVGALPEIVPDWLDQINQEIADIETDYAVATITDINTALYS